MEKIVIVIVLIYTVLALILNYSVDANNDKVTFATLNMIKWVTLVVTLLTFFALVELIN